MKKHAAHQSVVHREQNVTVAKLRSIIRQAHRGMNQSEFAMMIGASRDLIAKIETGKRPLTPEIARQIELATGVHADSLLANRDLRNQSGDPYSAEDYSRWRNDTRSLPESVIEETTQRAAVIAQKLFEAAASKHRLLQVSAEFNAWVSEVAKSYGLESIMNELMAAHDDLLPSQREHWRAVCPWSPSVTVRYNKEGKLQIVSRGVAIPKKKDRK